MKPLGNELCAKCGESFDPTIGECPLCHEKGAFFEQKNKYEKHSRVGILRNLFLFLTGDFGFQLIGIIVSLVVIISLTSVAQSSEELNALAYAPKTQLISNTATYLLTVIILLLICIKVLPEIFKTFKDVKSYSKGLGWGCILIVASTVVSIVASYLKPEITVVNTNQEILEGIIGNYPLISIFVFSLLGPFSEELTYRVGLFSLTSRFGKWLGYILTSLIFAFIHFNFQAIGTDKIVVELLALPNYIIAGAILSYVYDKYGLGASFIAHFVNNFVSIIMIIIAK